MKNLRSRMCCECGEREALYAPEGETRPQRCRHCMQGGGRDIDVKHPRCMVETCVTFVRSKDMMCATHAGLTPPKRHYERKLLDFFSEKELKFNSHNASPSPGSLCRYRPDFVFANERSVVVVECDEDQHRRYDSATELKREEAIAKHFKDKYVVFIRFNPAGYFLSSLGKSKCPRWVSRCHILENTLRNALSHPHTCPTRIPLFYDGT